jgi:two-component system catabolic regulation response regulator CreB
VPLVLLVDDEPAIRESLAFALKRDGFAIAEAASLRDAEQRISGTDLVILDLVLPDGSGLDFLRNLRTRSDVPVIVLTSRDEETDRVVGLEMGADDYVLKPFSPREVVARVRAVLRRVRGDRPQPETVEPAIEGPGRLRVDPRTRRASIGDTELALSRTEFNLLAAFLRAPGRVFERGQLLDAVWGADVVVGDRTVDVHVKALRRKLMDAGGDPKLLETVRGVGYRLKDGS